MMTRQYILHHIISPCGLMEVMFFIVSAKLCNNASLKLSPLKHRPRFVPDILPGRPLLTLSHLVWTFWSSPKGETKALTVRGWTRFRTTRSLALTQSSRRRHRPHRLSSFHHKLCPVLQLIAESWLE